jgi:hypothetical protein
VLLPAVILGQGMAMGNADRRASIAACAETAASSIARSIACLVAAALGFALAASAVLASTAKNSTSLMPWKPSSSVT